MMYWGDRNEIHPPAPIGKRVNSERISLDGKTKVIVTRWQWWKITFEGITTDRTRFYSKRWRKTGFIQI